jgi:hypothetical protein
VKWIGHLPVSNECLLWLLGDMNCAKTDEPWRLFRCFNSEPGCHQGANIRHGGTNNQPDEAVAVIRVLVAQLASVFSAWWFEVAGSSRVPVRVRFVPAEPDHRADLHGCTLRCTLYASDCRVLCCT